MTDFRYLKVGTLGLLLAFLISGCAGYGKTLMVRKGMPLTIDELASNSDDYNVYYHGNSPNLVSGIIFDPKNDHKTLALGGLWVKVADKSVIAGVITQIRGNDFPGYLPKHFQLIGANNGMYGYIYTGWFHVTVKQLDKDTLSVYGLKGPPEYEDAGPGLTCVTC